MKEKQKRLELERPETGERELKGLETERPETGERELKGLETERPEIEEREAEGLEIERSKMEEREPEELETERPEAENAERGRTGKKEAREAAGGIPVGITAAEKGKGGFGMKEKNILQEEEASREQESQDAEGTEVCQEKIRIPKIQYQGDDRKLKERVFKCKEGFLRIAIFTVLGLFMGYFSHTYVTDHFLPTKVILAIPYKITEAVYVSILGTDAPSRLAGRTMYTWLTEYFPHSMLATFMAEVVTTILTGGAIYGSLAYFTGDKRVFTLRRFLKFAGCWCALILLCIGSAYGINAKAVADNERLNGDPVFYLRQKDSGGLLDRGEAVQTAMREALYNGLEPVAVKRNSAEEISLEICFGEVRCGLYWVNCKDCYLATEGGRTYRISQDFARMVRDFHERGELPVEGGGQMEGEMSAPVSKMDLREETGKVSRCPERSQRQAGLVVWEGERICADVLQNRSRLAGMGGAV